MKEIEWVRQVARVRLVRNVYSFLFRKPEGKIPPLKIRPRCVELTNTMEQSPA